MGRIDNFVENLTRRPLVLPDPLRAVPELVVEMAVISGNKANDSTD